MTKMKTITIQEKMTTVAEEEEEEELSMFGSLGGATEGEIQAANNIVFGAHVSGAKLGRLMRINVHIGPGDHLGQRYSVTESGK